MTFSARVLKREIRVQWVALASKVVWLVQICVHVPLLNDVEICQWTTSSQSQMKSITPMTDYILHNNDVFLWYKYNDIAFCFIYKCVLHKGMYTVLHMIRKVL
jgi:hypothetical protein